MAGPREMRQRPEIPGGTLHASLLLRHARGKLFRDVSRITDSPKDRAEHKGDKDHEWRVQDIGPSA